MDLKLANRAYFVTGGSRGIGSAIVRLLLAEGASVATCARDFSGLESRWADLDSDARRRLLLRAVDILDPEEMAESVSAAASAFGKLDGVVANAGAGLRGKVLETDPAAWTRQFQIKVYGVLHLVRPAIEYLRESDAGRVVIMNGITAHSPDSEMAAVSAARAAVANLTRSLAVDLAPSSICVNAINLGPILSDRQRAHHDASGSELPFEAWCRQEAARRGVLLARMGRANEVSPLVAFLLSPLSSFLTGGSIDLAGGCGCRV